MTSEEALKELDQLSRAVKSGPVSEREVLCPEMREAAGIQKMVDKQVPNGDIHYGDLCADPSGTVSTTGRNSSGTS